MRQYSQQYTRCSVVYRQVSLFSRAALRRSSDYIRAMPVGVLPARARWRLQRRLIRADARCPPPRHIRCPQEFSSFLVYVAAACQHAAAAAPARLMPRGLLFARATTRFYLFHAALPRRQASTPCLGAPLSHPRRYERCSAYASRW